MDIIKKDLRQEALRLKAEQAQQLQGPLAINLTREDSRRRKREKVWCEHCSRFVTTHTPQSCWNKPGNPGLRRHRAASITFLQRRKTPKRLPKNGKQKMRARDFHHLLNSSVEPWNACSPNMKLINHDLKDKRILDSGAINHMTGSPELLDGIICLVPSISAYLGSNANRIIQVTQDLNPSCFSSRATVH